MTFLCSSKAPKTGPLAKSARYADYSARCCDVRYSLRYNRYADALTGLTMRAITAGRGDQSKTLNGLSRMPTFCVERLSTFCIDMSDQGTH